MRLDFSFEAFRPRIDPSFPFSRLEVDAMTVRMVFDPKSLDTIVATNLHADSAYPLSFSSYCLETETKGRDTFLTTKLTPLSFPSLRPPVLSDLAGALAGSIGEFASVPFSLLRRDKLTHPPFPSPLLPALLLPSLPQVSLPLPTSTPPE